MWRTHCPLQVSPTSLRSLFLTAGCPSLFSMVAAWCVTGLHGSGKRELSMILSSRPRHSQGETFQIAKSSLFIYKFNLCECHIIRYILIYQELYIRHYQSHSIQTRPRVTRTTARNSANRDTASVAPANQRPAAAAAANHVRRPAPGGGPLAGRAVTSKTPAVRASTTTGSRAVSAGGRVRNPSATARPITELSLR